MRLCLSVLALGVVSHLALTAAPVCSGSYTLSSLAGEGCQFGGTMFSSFNLEYAIGGVGGPVDQDNILVDIGPGVVRYGIFETAPALVVSLRPADGFSWSGGLFTGTSFGISFSAVSTDAYFSAYQAGGAEFSSFRHNRETVTVNPSGGTGPAIQGNSPPTFGIPPTPFALPVASFTATMDVLAAGGIFSSNIGVATAAFETTPVPEPSTSALFAAGLLLACIARSYGRSRSR